MKFILPLLLISVVFFQNCGSNYTAEIVGAPSTGSNNNGVDYSNITNPIAPNTVVSLISTGHGFNEGPLWVESLGSLLFSDEGNKNIYQWNSITNTETIFRGATSTANGNILSADGFLLTCESSPLRRIAKTNLTTKATTTLVNTYNGQPLNAPNDMVLGKNGAVYFTDPTYGTNNADIKQPVRGVYKVLPDGSIALIYGNLNQPNGIALSPDFRYLYVNDSAQQIIVKIELNTSGDFVGVTNFASLTVDASGNGYDGMAMDVAGNLYTGGNRAINIYNPLGQLIQTFNIGEGTTNMKFGGSDKKTLFVVSPTSVRKLPVLIPGI